MGREIEKTLDELLEEEKSIEESIQKSIDEINAKRRSVSEMKSKLSSVKDKIQAKKYDTVVSTVSSTYGLDIETFLQAITNGNVLIDIPEEKQERKPDAEALNGNKSDNSVS